MSLLRRQRERQQSKRFRLAKQQLCTCIALFLYISLPSLHDFDVKDVKLTSFTFYGQREQFSFSTQLNLDIRLRYSPTLPSLYLTLSYSYCVYCQLRVAKAKRSTLLKRKKKQSGNYFLNKYFLPCLHFRTYSLTNQPEEGCRHLSSSVPVSVASGLVN